MSSETTLKNPQYIYIYMQMMIMIEEIAVQSNQLRMIGLLSGCDV